ncbi:hypothetical protein Slin14017_G100670 [Septoria linicola]|nr:hypothetical protein Slin14017_G100670 [Septoria linicola]
MSLLNGRRSRGILVVLVLGLLAYQAQVIWRSPTDLLIPHIHSRDLRLGLEHLDPGLDQLGNVSVDDSSLYATKVGESKKYQTYAAKGCRLWEFLQRKKDPPGSEWSGTNDMANWGWQSSSPAGTLESKSSDARLSSLLTSIKDPLSSKGLDITSASGMINIETAHTSPTKPPSYAPNALYKPTSAIYFNIYNPLQGTIIAIRNYGPEYMSSKDPTWNNAPLPSMRAWSDVVTAVWTSLTSATGRQLLRYIVRINIQNQDTNDIVIEALQRVPGGRKNGVAPKWPGFTFKPPPVPPPAGGGASPTKQSKEMLKAFQAVLATPNVRGVVWLLLQHKFQLGAKTIKEIIVWDMSPFENQDAGHQLAVLIEIGDFQRG